MCCPCSPKPLPIIKQISFRKLKTLDLASFMHDITCRYLCNNAHQDSYLTASYFGPSIMTHVPLASKKVISRRSVLWINNDILEAKRQRRRAERKWRTTRRQSDLILFKKRRNCDSVSIEQSSARLLESAHC